MAYDSNKSIPNIQHGSPNWKQKMVYEEYSRAIENLIT